MTFHALGRTLGAQRRRPAPISVRTRVRSFRPSQSFDWRKLKAEVDAYVANLPLDQQAMLPLANSLPEIMVGIGLLLGGYQFTYQSWDNGGRLVLGGAVVDFQVSLGAKVVVIRVQGDYWHSLPVRALKDVAQFDLLKARGYLVWDAWEHAIYQAWLDGRIENFVREGIDTAI